MKAILETVSHAQCHVIMELAAANFLTDPRTSVLIEPFVEQESTITSASERVGISSLRMFRAVQRMENLGLIKVSKATPRRGRPQKHYRAVADRFFVPYNTIGSDTLEDFLLEQDDRVRRVLFRCLSAHMQEILGDESRPGRVIRRSPGTLENLGRMLAYSVANLQEANLEKPTPLLSSENSLGWSDYAAITLDRESALELRRELTALFAKYSKPHGKQQFLFRSALAPVREPLADLLDKPKR
jgi:predicted transcriptional regulator